MSESTTTLLVWSGTTSLDNVLAALKPVAGGKRLVGFLYAARKRPCLFTLEGDGLPRDQDRNEVVGWKLAFEMRLFDDEREVRLRRDGADWRIAVLSENARLDLPKALGLGEPELVDCCDMRVDGKKARPHQYLLWGKRPKKADTANGWTRLVTARIGELWVPFVDEHGRNGLVITAREYFRVAEDGNVVFAAERLTGFEGIERRLDENETSKAREAANV